MKKIVTLSFLFSLLLCTGCVSKKETPVITPTQKQQEWAKAEIGVLIHFDMPVYVPEYNWRNFGTHPDPSIFNPTHLNTDQWLETAQKLGATYAVLVAKHCSGFSLWPTEAHEYSIKNSPWKNGEGDIIKDFVASCKKYGIKPGLYASTSANGYLYVDNPGVVQEGAPVTQEEYVKIVDKQLTELWSNYGELFEIWFDGGVLAKERGGANVLDLVQELQPEAIAFQGPYGHPNLIRWVGNEEGVAPYPCWATTDSVTNADGTVVIEGLNGDPYGPFWCPGESDFTLRWNSSFQGGWFWRANEDEKMFTVDELMTKYETSVGRNTNMLLGIVIDERGLVPDADVARIEEFGKEIKKRYMLPASQLAGTGYSFVLDLNSVQRIDRAVIQEDISKGERILSYTLQGLTVSDKWDDISTGTCIGHKRIETFPAGKYKQIRLTINEAKAEPILKNFAVYSD